MTIVEQVKAAFRVSTPRVAVNTSDQEAAMANITAELSDKTAVVQWDWVRGMRARNNAGVEVLDSIIGAGDEADDDSVGNPLEAMEYAAKLPKNSVMFVINSHLWIEHEGLRQAIWNLRDPFKRTRRMIVLLTPDEEGLKRCVELLGDTTVFDEPLPDPEQLRKIAGAIFEAAEIEQDDKTLSRVVEAVQGLSAFQAEQVIAMACKPRDSIDTDAVWERKRKQIEQEPALRVSREGITFDDLGGVDEIKEYVRRIMGGKSRPNSVVFIDEGEKMLAGQGDTSGVSQDALGQILSYMEDHSATGLIFVGPPGAAKSAVAKAAGNDGGIPTIALDMGAAKGSLVGQSEQQLRSALKVISAVSNDRTLWIMTCNNISDLPPELKRRYKRGIFFFDLPSVEEREAIWAIYTKRYEIPEDMPRPIDEGWTGAEIEQCCFTAWDLDYTLCEAATKVVPVFKSAAKQIEALRKMSSGTFLSASYPGVYRRDDRSAYRDDDAASRKITDE